MNTFIPNRLTTHYRTSSTPGARASTESERLLHLGQAAAHLLQQAERLGADVQPRAEEIVSQMKDANQVLLGDRVRLPGPEVAQLVTSLQAAARDLHAAQP